MAKKKENNEKYIYQLLSNNIKRLRSLHNMSQLNLALNAGLTHNFINDIENCKKGVSYKTLAKFSSLFNVEPYQFFLPESMFNNEAMVYVKDFNDSLQKMVNDLTQQYLCGDKKAE
jgi:transcriptional regulator with XRE-family HTH domain